MKQHIQGAGVRQWYGDDMLELQSENLDVIQGFFEQFGPFILQGCAIAANGGNWDISAGLACIEHADGWKIVRVAAVTNTTLPGYFTVGKETVSGDYDSGAGTVAYRYHADNAQFTTGSTAAADTKLIIPDPGTAAPVRFKDVMLNLEEWTNVSSFGTGWTASTPVPDYTKDYSGRVYIRGAYISTNSSPDAVITTLPAGYRPAKPKALPCVAYNATTAAWYIAYINIYANGDVGFLDASHIPTATNWFVLIDAMFLNI